MWRAAVALIAVAVLGLAEAAATNVALRGPPRHGALLAHSTAGQATMKGLQGQRVRHGGEALEPWKDSGKAIAGRASVTNATTQVAFITPDGWRRELQALVDLTKSRFVAQPGNAQAGTYVGQRLGRMGYEVTHQAVQVSTTRWPPAATPSPGNVVAFLKGSDLAHETVVFGAHFDSVNWRNTMDVAPGADDDGSGIASLLQVAEVVFQQAKLQPLRRSVVFVAFQAEEVGLMGSEEFVKVAKTGQYGKVVAALIADQVGYSGRPEFKDQAIFETKGKGTNSANVALVDTLAHTASAEGLLKGFEINYSGFGSDHIPFLNAGIPSVLLIERDNMYYADNWGHSEEDTMDRVDPAYGASMARLAASTFLTLASPLSP